MRNRQSVVNKRVFISNHHCLHTKRRILSIPYSWPLLLNFMEKAQASAYEKHPELPDLVEKKKESKTNRIVTPEPLDELSSSTRSKVMSKLLKKV